MMSMRALLWVLPCSGSSTSVGEGWRGYGAGIFGGIPPTLPHPTRPHPPPPAPWRVEGPVSRKKQIKPGRLGAPGSGSGGGRGCGGKSEITSPSPNCSGGKQEILVCGE